MLHMLHIPTGAVGAFGSDGKRTVYIVISQVHPRSKGTVTLASSHPLESPILRAEYHKDPVDRERQVKGMKMVLELLQAPALEKFNFTMVPVTACSNYDVTSDDYYNCVVLADNYAMYHLAGSCKLGPASDRLAVVNPRLKVYEIDGLRVADASIMPQVISTNTQAPTIMIGERAAAFIKEDWSSATSY